MMSKGDNNLNSKTIGETPHQDIEPRFFFAVCPVSLKIWRDSDPLSVCAGCLSVAYADRDAQRGHWKDHKAICKALQPLVKNLGGSCHPLSQHPNKSAEISQKLQQSLGRPLTQFEIDILMYPRLCTVCFSGKQATLKNCPKCKCVAYCCEEHKLVDASNHSLSCDLLRICLEDHVHEMKVGHPALRGRFRPDIRNTCDLRTSDIETVLRPQLEDFYRDNFSKDSEEMKLFESELRHVTFRYSCQFSVLYGIQKSLDDLVLAAKKVLTVHVVGARRAETDDITRWEVLANGLVALQKLNVVFIGPELSWPYDSNHIRVTSETLRKVRPGLDVSYSFYKASYHDVVGGGLSPKPDCVAALNCGFIFYNSWDKSIPSMLARPGIPLIFTEYFGEDCRLDLDKVDELSEYELDIIEKPSENPYCSRLPARIPSGFELRKFKRRSVVMSNDFICVVQVQRE